MIGFRYLAVVFIVTLAAANAQAAPFHLLMESDAEVVDGTDELGILSYSSISDIVTGTIDDFVFTEKGVLNSYSTTGITFDGSDYHILIEFDQDTAGFAELAVFSYSAFGDIVSGDGVLQVTSLNVADGYSTTG